MNREWCPNATIAYSCVMYFSGSQDSITSMEQIASMGIWMICWLTRRTVRFRINHKWMNVIYFFNTFHAKRIGA